MSTITDYGTSIRVANAVVAAVEVFLGDREDVDVTIEKAPYLNGRERGIVLFRRDDETRDRANERAVAFAEHRSSDNIVVYKVEGERAINFVMDGTITSLTDEEYEASKHFSYGEYHKAAKYIVKFLVPEATR